MAFNMSRWIVQANNLYLPYADLDAAGSVGRLLTIPDDVGLTLAYLVAQGPLGFRTLKTDQYGTLSTSGTPSGYTQGYSITQVITGNATLAITIPFISSIQYIFNNGSAVRVTFTQYELGLPQISQIASAAASTNSQRTNSISVLNTTGTSTTFTMLAVAL